MAADKLRARGVQPATWTVIAAVAIMIAGGVVHAHKAVTSKYTYNEDVYPILRDKCGACHTAGGAAPMSLLTYNGDGGGAFAWAESMREMLTSEAMPPWYADPTGPSVKGGHALSARELDVLVTWASGGTPQGDLSHKPTTMVARVSWPLGKPDVEWPMPEALLPPGEMEKHVDLLLPTHFTDARWVKAADLLPGTPDMVRRATVSVENGPILSVWEPAHDSIAAPSGTAFLIPAGAQLHVQVDYKKPWQEEQQAKSDTSHIGLYVTDAPLSGTAISELTIAGGHGEGVAPTSLKNQITRAGRVIAIRPSLDQPYASIDVTAIVPSGTQVPLLKLRAARPEWPRRYWLADPVDLPAGTTIQATLVPGDPDAGPLAKANPQPLAMGIAIVWQ